MSPSVTGTSWHGEKQCNPSKDTSCLQFVKEKKKSYTDLFQHLNEATVHPSLIMQFVFGPVSEQHVATLCKVLSADSLEWLYLVYESVKIDS